MDAELKERDDPLAGVLAVAADAYAVDRLAVDSSGADDFRDFPRDLRGGGLSNRCCAAANERAGADWKTTEICARKLHEY